MRFEEFLGKILKLRPESTMEQILEKLENLSENSKLPDTLLVPKEVMDDSDLMEALDFLGIEVELEDGITKEESEVLKNYTDVEIYKTDDDEDVQEEEEQGDIEEIEELVDTEITLDIGDVEIDNLDIDSSDLMDFGSITNDEPVSVGDTPSIATVSHVVSIDLVYLKDEFGKLSQLDEKAKIRLDYYFEQVSYQPNVQISLLGFIDTLTSQEDLMYLDYLLDKYRITYRDRVIGDSDGKILLTMLETPETVFNLDYIINNLPILRQNMTYNLEGVCYESIPNLSQCIAYLFNLGIRCEYPSLQSQINYELYRILHKFDVDTGKSDFVKHFLTVYKEGDLIAFSKTPLVNSSTNKLHSAFVLPGVIDSITTSMVRISYMNGEHVEKMSKTLSEFYMLPGRHFIVPAYFIKEHDLLQIHINHNPVRPMKFPV